MVIDDLLKKIDVVFWRLDLRAIALAWDDAAALEHSGRRGC
jgi:hypothetical protein